MIEVLGCCDDGGELGGVVERRGVPLHALHGGAGVLLLLVDEGGQEHPVGGGKGGEEMMDPLGENPNGMRGYTMKVGVELVQDGWSHIGPCIARVDVTQHTNFVFGDGPRGGRGRLDLRRVS